MDKFKDLWIEHDNEGWPSGVHPNDWVNVIMASDGHRIGPIMAEMVDWRHDDAVDKYQIHKHAGEN